MTVRWISLCELIECLGCRPDGLQVSQTVVAYATMGRGAPPASTGRRPADFYQKSAASTPQVDLRLPACIR
jgi:hypothetical protein